MKHGSAPQAPRDGGFSARIVAHPSDHDVARHVDDWLTRAGVSRPPADGHAEAVVVILSAEALADPAWLGPGEFAGRVVPLRVGALDAELVPEPLRRLNWLDWQPAVPAATLGALLAALYADPARRELIRDLSYQATAWESARRPDAMVIDDYRRARQMADALNDIAGDRTGGVSASMADFVRRSLVVSQRRRRNLRVRQTVLAAVVAAAVLIAAVAYPLIRRGGFNNHEAIATTGEPILVAEMPEWTAANAAALLRNGSPPQQQLARATLLETLNQPWTIGDASVIEAKLSVVLFHEGRHAAVLFRDGPVSALAVLDIRTSQIQWTVDLPVVYWDVSVSADDETALVVGRYGAAVVDLRARAVRALPGHDEYLRARLNGSQTAAVRMLDGRIGLMDMADGALTVVATYSEVTAVVALPSGGGVALVREAADRMAMIDLMTGRTVASGVIAAAEDAAGDIAPDGRQAIVEGADGQFWRFGTGTSATPTGIVVPAGVVGFAWVAPEVGVVFSTDRRAEVYYLPRAEPLGMVCHDVPRIREVRGVAGSDELSCFGETTMVFVHLPSGPIGSQGGLVRTRTSSAGGTSVVAEGSQVRVRWQAAGSAQALQPLASAAAAVAVSADGRQVLVGADDGSVLVIDLSNPGGAVVVVRWHTPDRAAVIAAGWASGPIVQSASGQTWAVPSCADCVTDTGLIETFQQRFTGCLSTHQLEFMDSETRQLLGIRECARPIGSVS
ncbi:hypothetical protein KUA19_36970 [Catellatospora sp. NEAU-YM18]|nr:hypothetical protein [Catellatospora tritici]